MCFRSSSKANVRHNLGSSSSRDSSRRRLANYSILLYASLLLLLQLQLSPAAHAHAAAATAATAGRVTKGLGRTRAAKIASIHGLQAVAESLPSASSTAGPIDVHLQDKPANGHMAGKYEIRSVSGEPNYKSVNLTWEVEFVPAPSSSSSSLTTLSPAASVADAVTNSSAEVEPPKIFQIFFCELQSFGPHRCRSKLVNESQHLEQSNQLDEEVGEKRHRQLRHYTVEIENLRMATKYSFHIRPQLKRRNMKITGRSELFGNEIDDELKQMTTTSEGQTIIIPTKGFSAQATKCLPHASEIEVETGPYFGGKIVVDGGNCGVKGNPDDPTDKYTMRIDHEMCGSMVKPETNTVETFITVQENLGIFTHSTRRFVVVCSFQSGMQTVRASFTVPGKDGVAAAVENDPFEPDDRLGREQRQMRYVDKSALILKDHVSANVAVAPELSSAEESEAVVREVPDPANNATAALAVERIEADDATNAVAVLEDIIPGVNERDIKHENEVFKARAVKPAAPAHLVKYEKLVSEQAASIDDVDDDVVEDLDADATEWYRRQDREENRGIASSLHYISANAGSVVVTASLSVIILGVFIFIVYREARRQRFIRSNIRMEQLQSSASSVSSLPSLRLHSNRPMPRALQPQPTLGSM